ncbi:hypothetical protein LXA43DRAFT_922969 [Ganoderma leucocontextum]|nr:hypothetical protein LXA43DRAFT_922969 [Ganoderma leucocontextum]
MEDVHATQSAFQRLKGICIPLLGNSLLTPSSTPAINSLLSQLHHTLLQLKAEGHVFASATISYVFFPLSSILRRNDVSVIPDQSLEKILAVLAFLSDVWWWDMDVTAWEQVFMLCSAILGGIDRKGKGKDRDDETKLTATHCLWALLRERAASEHPAPSVPPDRARSNLATFRNHVQTYKFLPVLGQTLDSLLNTAESNHLPLQRMSLKVLTALATDYLPDGFVPLILPGTVSTMTKVALGTGATRGWANGDIVATSLLVIQRVIVRAVGNDICIREGAIRIVDHIEDLVGDLHSAKPTVETPSSSSFSTQRTATWLRAVTSQLHIALNSLSPLVKHQTPAALIGLAAFSANVLSATTLTLPQSRPLLLSFLLSLRGSAFDRVACQADASLRQLLTAQSNPILQALLQISSDNLAALPRLLLSHTDSKVEHVAGILESVCQLAASPDSSRLPAVTAISMGVGKLLGPHGGVEKWGWSLLSTLEFVNPPIVVTQTSAAQLMLESDPATVHVAPFPELTFRHVSSRSTQEALERMFRALGSTAGDECLFAVEWFVDVGFGSRGSRAVAALWCGCRLLEGAGRVTLNSPSSSSIAAGRGKRLEKFARDLTRRIAEAWDDWDDEEVPSQEAEHKAGPSEENTLIEHVRGLVTVRGVPGTEGPPSAATAHSTVQPLLHRGLLLQLLAVAAGILEARFLPLLLHVLYPVLHGIVSETSFVSASGLAALNSITNSTSYATPANLLLSNFDYALDSVSRRLTRRWLDVDATKVLVVLVRLIGRDVVQKAGDVVEECFDRLDEFHGYEMIVDGLVEVLGEVVKAIEEDEENRISRESRTAPDHHTVRTEDGQRLDKFVDWFAGLKENKDETDNAGHPEPLRDDSYPRESWAKEEEEEGNKDAGDTPEGNASTTQPGARPRADDPFAEAPPTPSQALTTQIVSRSIYFLTHGAPTVRARILLLLARSVPVLPEAALLPAVHSAWPFVLNRLADVETFVVAAAASLVAALAEHVGDFMARRVWDDVWPRFRELLKRLAQADKGSALARRAAGVGTGSAYTHSHRLYRAVIQTMTAAARGVQAQDAEGWEVIVLFRRFLRSDAHEELQACARELYVAVAENNEDAVWLAMAGTLGWTDGPVAFLREPKWDIEQNVRIILSE